MMAREFNQGMNELPQSSIGENPYPLAGRLKAGEATSEYHSIYEIESHNASTTIYTLKRPSEDNIPPSRVVFGASQVEASDDAPTGFCAFDKPRWVAFDTGEGVPAVGDYVGTLADSYKLSKHRFGFECLDFNNTENLCLVRPLSMMPLLVIAVTDPVAGTGSTETIDVKFAEVDGTEVGDAFTVYVVD